LNDVAPEQPDRFLYEHRVQSDLWQERAQALKEIKENRYYLTWTYRDTPSNQQQALVGKTYPSVGAFTEDLPDRPMPYKSAYRESKFANEPHFQHYALLRTANISYPFANLLYQLPLNDPVIEALLLYMHFGGHEERANKILTTSKSPLQDAKALLKERIDQQPHLMAQAVNLYYST
jgi:hypothetical protein